MTTKTMKPGKLMILALALVGLAVTGQGQVTKCDFTDNVSGVIPDADPVGLTRTIEVSGMDGRDHERAGVPDAGWGLQRRSVWVSEL